MGFGDFFRKAKPVNLSEEQTELMRRAAVVGLILDVDKWRKDGASDHKIPVQQQPPAYDDLVSSEIRAYNSPWAGPIFNKAPEVRVEWVTKDTLLERIAEAERLQPPPAYSVEVPLDGLPAYSA